jgi:hypothetical protein
VGSEHNRDAPASAGAIARCRSTRRRNAAGSPAGRAAPVSAGHALVTRNRQPASKRPEVRAQISRCARILRVTSPVADDDVSHHLGLLVTPLLIAGFARLWRTPELRFIDVTAMFTVGYVLAWVPGKTYYTDGMAPAVLAA